MADEESPDVEFVDWCDGCDEELCSSEDRPLEGVTDSSLVDDELSSVVVAEVTPESDVAEPESESERIHEERSEEPSDPSEESSDELLSELWSLETLEETLEETSEDGGLLVELPPPPPLEERIWSVSEMSPPFEGTWSGSSQRSSCGGSGHCSRGSSGPISRRKRGAWSNSTRTFSMTPVDSRVPLASSIVTGPSQGINSVLCGSVSTA